ncbi:hypothetical protein PPYR_04488 [Photinus pyralis]|uniref:Uncharacterized protein n=2 Tax=Photinus pyralis TaxID=7054 RepID=A0A5N4AY65_PHOPY|nr:hypothetical protein PPYR_04488 [Photinus pyralis]
MSSGTRSKKNPADASSEEASTASDPPPQEKWLSTIMEKQTANILNSIDIKFNEFYESLKELKSDLSKTISRVDCAEEKLDDLEQYVRRNNLRIFGVKEAVGEDTDQIVIALIKNKLNIDISLNDLERSHRVGPKVSQFARPIIVKFCSYRKRAEVFGNKKLLKKTGFVIREDLTKRRYKLVQSAQEKYGKNNVWTADGKIVIKKSDNTVSYISNANNL